METKKVDFNRKMGSAEITSSGFNNTPLNCRTSTISITFVRRG